MVWFRDYLDDQVDGMYKSRLHICMAGNKSNSTGSKDNRKFSMNHMVFKVSAFK
jgi:hypothetical protein